MQLIARSIIVALAVGSSMSTAVAHFPFLATNEAGEVVLFFGENLFERTYKIPPAIEKAIIKRFDRDGEATPMESKVVETEQLLGISTGQVLKPGEAAVTQIRYGVYHGTLLDYSCVHLPSLPKKDDKTNPFVTEMPFQARLAAGDRGIEVLVTWHGQPIQSAKVSLSCSDGNVESEQKTDGDGIVRFSNEDIKPGLNALLIGHQVKDKGQWEGQKYESGSHYLTVTFLRDAQ